MAAAMYVHITCDVVTTRPEPIRFSHYCGIARPPINQGTCVFNHGFASTFLKADPVAYNFLSCEHYISVKSACVLMFVICQLAAT